MFAETPRPPEIGGHQVTAQSIGHFAGAGPVNGLAEPVSLHSSFTSHFIFFFVTNGVNSSATTAATPGPRRALLGEAIPAAAVPAPHLTVAVDLNVFHRTPVSP